MNGRFQQLTAVRGLPALNIATLTMYGGGAALLFVSVVAWEPGRNPRWFIGALALTAALFAVYTALRGRSFTSLEALAMAGVQFAAIGALTWNTHIAMAAYANGTIYPLVAIYVVWFLHPLYGRLTMYVGVAWWFVAVTQHEGIPVAGYPLTTVVQAVLAAEVFGLIKKRMDSMARTDPLTGLLNRRGIHEVFYREINAARRRGHDLSVVTFDMDGLRDINNALGHRAGDELLQTVAQHWARHIRRQDAIGRIGGDEFLLVLPRTRGEDAQRIVQRMSREAPAAWSAGVATVKDHDTMTTMLERADRRMYSHKLSRQA